MQVQVNTDHNIEGREALSSWISGVVETAMERMSDRITRVEVHLSDENSDKKTGDRDMRCMMEARLEGRKPVAVTNQGATVNEAVDGAAEKLSRLLESTIGRLQHPKGRAD